jgi:hypothetical protein
MNKTKKKNIKYPKTQRNYKYHWYIKYNILEIEDNYIVKIIASIDDRIKINFGTEDMNYSWFFNFSNTL